MTSNYIVDEPQRGVEDFCNLVHGGRPKNECKCDLEGRHAHNISKCRSASSRVTIQYRDHQTSQETGAENGQSKRKFGINYIPHYCITPEASGSGTTIPRHDYPPMQRAQQELGVQRQGVSLQNPNRPLRQFPSNAAILCRIRIGR